MIGCVACLEGAGSLFLACFPVAESLAPRGLSFPSAVTLSEASLKNIGAVTRSILEMRQMVNAS